MRYQITEPLEEVANRIACGGMPADKKRSYRQDQNDFPEQTTHKCCHSAPRSAVFNISGAFLVGTPRCGLRTAQRAVPTSWRYSTTCG
jgi:hypothetical protein